MGTYLSNTLHTQIYETDAQQAAPANLVNTNGSGRGYVDIYDTNGRLIEQVFAGGALNVPEDLRTARQDYWGLRSATDGVCGRIDLTTP